MSGAGEEDGRGQEPPEGAGVLGNLPRTRPQRATARRAAAREAGAAAEKRGQASANGNGRVKQRTPKKAATTTAKAPASGRRSAAKTAKPGRRTRTAAEAVPRQGFESLEERATGPVQPPGSTELIGTAAEALGELAKAGISGGERVLRDLLSRLGR